jgi:hypothetical protein
LPLLTGIKYKSRERPGNTSMALKYGALISPSDDWIFLVAIALKNPSDVK